VGVEDIWTSFMTASGVAGLSCFIDSPPDLPPVKETVGDDPSALYVGVW
jgi:hypothetical protein